MKTVHSVLNMTSDMSGNTPAVSHDESVLGYNTIGCVIGVIAGTAIAYAATDSKSAIVAGVTYGAICAFSDHSQGNLGTCVQTALITGATSAVISTTVGTIANAITNKE